MKITQGQAVSAFTVLKSMGRRQLNPNTAFQLFKLKKKLEDIVEFQIEQENNLAESLGGTIDNGRLNLPDDKLKEYAEKHKEISDTECEIDTEKVTLSLGEIPTITIDEIEALDPVITFIE